MSNKYKYIMNMGLAFDEDRAMKKLSEMAKEGWILEEMTLFRYKLVKGEPQQLIYTMDYKQLDKNEDEYFQIFEDSGWKHMCSYGEFHFFAAPPQTTPIYTDKENYLNKYVTTRDGYKKSAVITSIMLVIISLIEYLLRGKIEGTIAEYTLIIIGMFSAGIAVPSIMVSIAYSIKQKRV